jgi:hypothetical protein
MATKPVVILHKTKVQPGDLPAILVGVELIQILIIFDVFLS